MPRIRSQQAGANAAGKRMIEIRAPSFTGGNEFAVSRTSAQFKTRNLTSRKIVRSTTN